MGEEEKKVEQEEAKKPEEEKKPAEEEKKAEESKEPPPPQDIVFRVYMHCEGCARKVRTCLRGFQGVEDVQTDCKTHKVVVKGEKADPLKVLSVLQRKCHKQVELVSPIPKPPTVEEMKSEENKENVKPEEKKEELLQVITVVLRVHMHCDACAQQIEKCIQRMKGVESANADMKSSLVTVKGAFDPQKLVEYVYKKTKKHALIVKTEPEKKEEKSEEENKGGEVEKNKGGEVEKKEGEDQTKQERSESNGGGGGGGEETKVKEAEEETKVVAEVNTDPLKVLGVLQRKCHKQVELVSPIPKPPTVEEKKSEENKENVKPEEKKEEVITVVLRVHMHCDACAQQIEKCIQGMKGVESANADIKSSLVTVKGAFDPQKLVEYVYKKMKFEPSQEKVKEMKFEPSLIREREMGNAEDDEEDEIVLPAEELHKRAEDLIAPVNTQWRMELAQPY